MLNLLTDLTTWVEGFYNSQYAASVLGIIALAESIFSPIIPDIFLISISILKPETAIWMALITVIGSITGAVIGYHISKLIGVKLIHRFIKQKHLESAYNLFQKYGIWVILIAAFTPIPYKLFTITAGILSMALIPFILFSLVGRGARFFLVAAFIFWGGESLERLIRKYIDLIGWVVVISLVFFYLFYLR